MGANIKKLCEEPHLALESVADKIGVTEIEMKRIEKRWDGPSPIVSRAHLRRLTSSLARMVVAVESLRAPAR